MNQVNEVSALRTRNGFTNPHSGEMELIRQKLPADLGNRFLKWQDPIGEIRCIPSFVKELESWEDAQPDQNSVVVEVEGKRYALGQIAHDLDGKPVFEHSKTELAYLLALAAIEPNPGQNQVIIESMPVALPDSRNKEAVSGVKRIEKTRDFRRNGQRIIAIVRNVTPIDETKAAYSYAVKQGLFKYQRPNGVLDCGGGTAIARLYALNGTVIREADTILPGTYALAQKISAALTPQLGYTPNLSLLMDAIADSSFDYGTTGFNFKPIFEKCRESWILEIRAKLKTAWGKWGGELGEVLVIGGSAPLLKPLEEESKGRFKIAPEPQFISIRGMLEA